MINKGIRVGSSTQQPLIKQQSTLSADLPRKTERKPVRTTPPEDARPQPNLHEAPTYN